MIAALTVITVLLTAGSCWCAWQVRHATRQPRHQPRHLHSEFESSDYNPRTRK